MELLNSTREYNVISIEEKPKLPKSSYAIPGLYIYDETVVERLKNMKLSPRRRTGNYQFRQNIFISNSVECPSFRSGIAWLDMGLPDSLLEAGEFIGRG